MKYFMVLTYGCQMNKHDTEKVVYLLEKKGWHKTADEKKASLIILLTCSVREKAEAKVLGKLGELKTLKKKNPHLLIGIGGCMTQQKSMSNKIRVSYPQVDILFGTHNLHRLGDLLDKAMEKKMRVMEIWDEEVKCEEMPVSRERWYRAWVSIIQGCNNYCSYCIVPYVRGRERSRPFQEIISEVEGLVQDGVIEVTLLGQNVNSYGKDLGGEKGFGDLLKALNTIPGLARIRFTTSHPRDFQLPIIEAIASSEKVCEHIHLPLQSGSSNILKKMNRGYTKEEYLKCINEIRKRLHDVAITTDIMVGFPGEEEEDFLHTLDVLEMVRFTSVFTFLYSPRKNTPAAQIEDPTPSGLKKERFLHLLKVQKRINQEENQKYLGRVVEVLGEGESKKDAMMEMGRTRTNIVVIFPKDKDREGSLFPVKIEEARSWDLFGTSL